GRQTVRERRRIHVDGRRLRIFQMRQQGANPCRQRGRLALEIGPPHVVPIEEPALEGRYGGNEGYGTALRQAQQVFGERLRRSRAGHHGRPGAHRAAQYRGTMRREDALTELLAGDVMPFGYAGGPFVHAAASLGGIRASLFESPRARAARHREVPRRRRWRRFGQKPRLLLGPSWASPLRG